MQPDFLTAGAFIAGLALLIGGAELLVRGASRLAASFGISSLVIGLTVVAFGTGSPELAVSVRSAFSGQPDIALGNVVGSNIFNMLFILGLSALIVPLIVHHQLVRLDVPLMIGVTIILFLMAADGTISRMDGLSLIAGITAYTVILVIGSRKENGASHGEAAPARQARTVLQATAAVIVGLAFLILGARWLVDGAVTIARALGVSELVIALTIIAAGTSLPEVATSVVAGVRGQRDIAVGNVVGSNIYNIMLVLGGAALLSPHGLSVAPALIHFDIPVLLAVSLACFPIFFSGNVITRWQGGMFLAYWIAYTTYVILLASQHDALSGFNRVMTLFALPLTSIMLIVLTVSEARRRWRRRPGG